MLNKKILAVDDEEHILELVKFNLEKEGFEVVLARDGQEALDRAAGENPDLVVLDLMLPGMDGWEVCRRLQRDPSTQDIPIIMLTARAEEIDKVLGLEMGAEDYMTKPFSPRELVARVKARLRRVARGQAPAAAPDSRYNFGIFRLDPEGFTVSVGGNKLDLTPKEFELLKYLVENRGKVLSRERLLSSIWGYDYIGDSRTVDVHIRHLRQKIEQQAGRSGFIETIHGVGYKFEELSYDKRT